MTRAWSRLGLALAVFALAAPARADLTDDFQDGLRLLKRGQRQEALAAFQRALAADPSNAEAYELWKATDQEIFLEMLVSGGEWELIAKRFMERASLGRRERRYDRDAIADKVTRLQASEDALERQRIIRDLSAEHGEYAVPRLIRPLADPGDEDWRIVAMHTLTEMDTDVVLPLIAALETEDAYLRANIALVLGYIGDSRAAAALTALAHGDSDTRVQRAARQAAERCGSDGDTLSLFLRLGEDYHYRRPGVLRDIDYSNVVWSWEDGTLTSHTVPRLIYNNELSKRAYYAALDADPTSLDALAGIARASTEVASKLEALAASGEDVDDLLTQTESGVLAVAASGVAAIDRALQWSVITEDASTGIRLCRVLAELAGSPTDGLLGALDSPDGGMRAEAAVALGRIASQNGAAAPPQVVAALGANVGREVVRIAAVIDGNEGRASAVVNALASQGVVVNHRGSGAQGIALLRRIPNVDVILVGDTLPDMTFDQVLSDVARSAITADVPVLLLTSNQDLADDYSERITASMAGGGDLSAVDAVFEAGLTGDRAQADDLARRSAEVLADLARSGNSSAVAGILDELTRPLAHRDDAVTVPAMEALAAAGTPDQVAPLGAVVTDGARSDEARAAAANALAGIFGRHPVTSDALAGLHGVVTSDASLVVRVAVARALGRVRLADEDRRVLVQDLRVDVHGED